MRRLFVATCLLATICAYHINRPDFNVVIESVEYKSHPAKFKLSEKIFLSEQNFAPSIEILKKIAHDVEINPRAGTEAIMNDYADQIFTNIQHLMISGGFDPFALPDMHSGFNYTLIITYHGELDLTTGWLQDISTIHRGGDVVVAYNTQTKYLEITVPIAFNDLQFSYDYSAKIMGLGPTGGIAGKIADVAVEVKLGFDVVNLVASLDEFEITNSGHINVDFNGNPLVDWLINLLTDVVTALLKPLILGIVEDVIKGALTGAVDAINDAINGLLNPTTTVAPTTAAIAYLYT